MHVSLMEEMHIRSTSAGSLQVMLLMFSLLMMYYFTKSSFFIRLSINQNDSFYDLMVIA